MTQDAETVERVAAAMWESRNETKFSEAVNQDLIAIYRGLARAALDAMKPTVAEAAQVLPDMIEPLVWDQTDGVLTDQKIWSYDSNQTQWIVQNGENGDFVLCESLTIDFAPCSPVTGVYKTLESAKAAANNHYRAQIMAAFGKQVGEDKT